MIVPNSVGRRPSAWRWLRIAAVAAIAIFAANLSLSAVEASGPTNRQSCAAIEGTRYKSSVERDWYWQYCMTGVATTGTASGTQAGVMQQFSDGYRRAGGPEHLLNHILYRVIPCESLYNAYAVNHGGPYYGLMQFYPSTWYGMGGGDWFSPWWQGYNTARLIHTTSPATQWPHCWYA